MKTSHRTERSWIGCSGDSDDSGDDDDSSGDDDSGDLTKQAKGW